MLKLGLRPVAVEHVDDDFGGLAPLGLMGLCGRVLHAAPRAAPAPPGVPSPRPRAQVVGVVVLREQQIHELPVLQSPPLEKLRLHVQDLQVVLDVLPHCRPQCSHPRPVVEL